MQTNLSAPFTVYLNPGVIIGSLICFAPLLIWFVMAQKRLKSFRKNHRFPFAGLSRRPAGESLRLEITRLDEKIIDRLYLLISIPVAFAVSILVLSSTNAVSIGIFSTFSIIWTILFGSRLWKLIESRRNYQLGFDGERYVAEELNRVIPLGYEVFHDVPFDGFNIDHVLIGKSGVFTIETKTRSKPVDEAGNKQSKVVFDGKSLVWPKYESSKELTQARGNSQEVSKWLSKATGQHVASEAVLTLPGWWVERKAPENGVHVLNPREIYDFCKSSKRKLDENLAERITYQLEQKCSIKAS